jgi:hypothetical protein
VVFDRDPADGTLSQMPGTAGCVSSTGWANPMNPDTLGQCQDGIALYGVNAVAVSPDGAAVYASARLSDGIAVLERLADGGLAQRPGQDGCVTETGYEVPDVPPAAGLCHDGRALREAGAIAVGPDSRQVYTAARQGGVGVFDVVPPAVPPSDDAAALPHEAAPASRERSACKRVTRRRRAVTRALSKALSRQGRLRRRLDRGENSPKRLEALHRAHRRVKQLRRKRHLLKHRERRVCR